MGEKKINVKHALEAVSDYMRLANQAGRLGIGGFQTSVGLISHALGLISLAKLKARDANENQCISDIDNYLWAWRKPITAIRESAKADVENLRAEMKGDGRLSHHRQVNRWVCLNMLGVTFQPEIEAYSHNRRGIEEKSTRARFGSLKGNWEDCFSKNYVVERAKKLQEVKVDAFVKGKEDILFPETTEKLFAKIKRITSCGNGFVKSGICENESLCCSKFGWCGGGYAHCISSPYSGNRIYAASSNSTGSSEK